MTRLTQGNTCSDHYVLLISQPLLTEICDVVKILKMKKIINLIRRWGHFSCFRGTTTLCGELSNPMWPLNEFAVILTTNILNGNTPHILRGNLRCINKFCNTSGWSSKKAAMLGTLWLRFLALSLWEVFWLRRAWSNRLYKRDCRLVFRLWGKPRASSSASYLITLDCTWLSLHRRAWIWVLLATYLV
jgi:hypothetical protein